MALPAPCGTFAAYLRHKRKGESVDEACAAAAREQKNVRKDAERAVSGAAVAEAVAGEVLPGADELDPLEEARDNLRIIRAALNSGPPHNTVAALTKRRDEAVDRIRQLLAETPEVSAFDQLAARRKARGGAEAAG